MREARRSFAERALGGRADEPADIREAVGKERQWTGRAYELELRSRDGREHEALSWALYQRRRWRSGDGEESLVLVFANAIVSISGSNLRRLTEMIRDERLVLVQELDAAEAALLEAENRRLESAMRKAVITSIAIEPSFDEALDGIRADGATP